MAKKIIILSRGIDPGDIPVDFILWLEVPSNRQVFYADANAASAYGGATTGEIDDLKSGAKTEVPGRIVFPGGTTLTQMGQRLVQEFNTQQELLNNETKWTYYGTYWDGTSWTVGGN